MAKTLRGRRSSMSTDLGRPVVAPPVAERQNVKRSAKSGRPARRSIVLSGIAIVGIAVFVTGAVLTVLGFFVPNSANSGSFTGRMPGMKVSTTNVGLALAFLGLMFTAVVRLLRPAAGALFHERDSRTWVDRASPLLEIALLLLALTFLAILIFRVA